MLKKVTDRTTIRELIELCYREIYSESFVSDKLMKEIVRDDMDRRHAIEPYQTIGDIKYLFSIIIADKMKTDKEYYDSVYVLFYEMLGDIRNLRIYYLADFVYDYFINKIFPVLDFRAETECNIWERFWSCIGQIGNKNHFHRSINLFDKYVTEFSDNDSYLQFSYAYLVSLFQINYRFSTKINYGDHLMIVSQIINKIPRTKKDQLLQILGSDLSSSYLPSQIGDDMKRYDIYLINYFRPMLLT